MGFRFRKTFTFGLFRTSLSKSGIGGSVGFKGFRYTLRADGKRQKTVSIPGTGVSFVDTAKSDSQESHVKQDLNSLRSKSVGISWGSWILILFGLLLILVYLIQFIK
jgi:uncharacterized protein DUF4236